MSYLWEHYATTNHYTLAQEGFSPYVEIFDNINDNSNMKVNILYRFGTLYNDVSKVILNKEDDSEEKDREEEKKEKEKAADILFHMLANIDFYAGITQKDIHLMRIEKEIREGRYGRLDGFEHLIFQHKYALLSYMYLRKKNNRDCLFFDYLVDVFGASLMYSEFEDTYIVQISCSKDTSFGEKNAYSAETLYEIAKKILCDIWLNVEVYWQAPIGICGEKMELDNLQIV